MTGTGPKYNLIERKTFSGRIERRTEIVMIVYCVTITVWSLRNLRRYARSMVDH